MVKVFAFAVFQLFKFHYLMSNAKIYFKQTLIELYISNASKLHTTKKYVSMKVEIFKWLSNVYAMSSAA